MKKNIGSAALLILLMIALPTEVSIVSAKTTHESPEQIAERVQQRYQEITSLFFLFFQTTQGQMAGRPKNGKGNAIFAKTGDANMMRWNYHAPDTQIVISDGTTVSMYFEKLKQMIITPVDVARVDILFSLFNGEQAFTDNFILLPPETESVIETDITSNGQPAILQLQPLQQESQVRTIHLFISADSLIRRIELIDYFDTKTTINLTAIEINPIDVTKRTTIDELFTFTPPEGTEIIRQ